MIVTSTRQTAKGKPGYLHKPQERLMLVMLMKDLNTLVKHMDSIKTLNHTFPRLT